MRRSTLIQVVLASVVALAAGTALALLHRENSRLQRQLANRPPHQPAIAAFREENAQLHALVDLATRDAAAAAAMTQIQLKQARTEIAGLEKSAAEIRLAGSEQAAREASALDTNRDPRQGLTRLTYFQNMGRATPAAAVQTAVWAAMQGDKDLLSQIAMLPPEAQKQAEALIARLPENLRAQWTPDKLATLWLASVADDIPAMQIVREDFQDAAHATVTTRISREDQTDTVQLRLTPTGWALVLPKNAIAKLERKMGALAAPKP